MAETLAECARCGYPRHEHSYNGACYGLCGKFEEAMTFEPVAPVFPDVPMWAARKGDHSFIITSEGGIYASSVRRAYTTEPRPIYGQVTYLGQFPSMQLAIEACDRWKP
jgi:hypothetical protein